MLKSIWSPSSRTKLALDHVVEVVTDDVKFKFFPPETSTAFLIRV